jgi:hypothetical protein
MTTMPLVISGPGLSAGFGYRLMTTFSAFVSAALANVS